MNLRSRILAVLTVACAWSCASRGEDGGWGSGGDATGNGDEGGGAGDGNSGGDGDDITEDESDANLRVPEASGRYLYAAGSTLDSVAIIDTVDLSIDVVEVGRGPSVIINTRALADASGPEGRVAVLSPSAREVALLETGAQGDTSVRRVAVAEGANALVATPDGNFVCVYHDVDAKDDVGPGSDQELTVIDTRSGAQFYMSVGAHPREVIVEPNGARAHVVTADGISIVDFSRLDVGGKPVLIPVVDDLALDPSRIEVRVAGATGQAIARIQGANYLIVTDLATGAQRRVNTSRTATDLDIAPAGNFAIATLPGRDGSSFVELTLPFGPDDQPREISLGSIYAGQSEISATGDAILFFTTVRPSDDDDDTSDDDDAGSSESESSESSGDTQESESSTSDGSDDDSSSSEDEDDSSETSADLDMGYRGTDDGVGDDTDEADDPRIRVTLVRREAGAWSTPHTSFVEHPVRSIGIAPDGASAILIQQDQIDGRPVWPYTLLGIDQQPPIERLQYLAAPVVGIVVTPDSRRGMVLSRHDQRAVSAVDVIDVSNFTVRQHTLASPVQDGGYVSGSDLLFVSQRHVSGRVTFIGSDGELQTITGFELNDGIKD